MGADGRRGRGAGRRHLATRAAHIPHTAALGSPLVRAALDRDVGPLDVGFLVGPGVVAAAPTQGPGPLAGPEDGPSLLTPRLTLASGPELGPHVHGVWAQARWYSHRAASNPCVFSRWFCPPPPGSEGLAWG